MGRLLEWFRRVWANNIRMVIWLFVFGSTVWTAWQLFGRWFLYGIVAYAVVYVIRHARDLGSTRREDWINPVKWMSVIYATFTKMLFPLHVIEQIVLRIYDKECRQCVMAGKCKYCSCDMSKVLSPFDECSADPANWGQVIEDAKEYWAMRREFPVVISVRYPKEEQAQAMQFNPLVLEKYKDAKGNLDIKAALLDLKPSNMDWPEFISRTRALGLAPLDAVEGAWVRSKDEPGLVVFDPTVKVVDQEALKSEWDKDTL